MAKISVIIPAYNEEHFLARTLGSLRVQTFQDFEVIVVDNNSTDETSQVAKENGAMVIFEAKKGPAFACNTGFAAAQGSILVRTDADTMMPKNWLEKICHDFEQDKQLIALGGPIYPLESSWWENSIYYPALLFWTFCLRVFGKGFFITQIAFRKEAFLKTGGYDTSLTVGEDLELSNRLRNLGKIKFDFGLYIFSSTRRMRANGLIHFIIKYTLRNQIAIAFNKASLVRFEAIRFVPQEPCAPKTPWYYLWQLPFVILSLVVWGMMLLPASASPDRIQTKLFAHKLAQLQTRVSVIKNEITTKLPTPAQLKERLF